MAEGNEYLMQATKELYECNADELIRQQCFAREEYNRYQRTIKKALKDATEERDCALATIREQENTIQKKDATIQEQKTALQEKDSALQEKDASLQEKDAALQEKDAALQEQDAEIARLQALLNAKS